MDPLDSHPDFVSPPPAYSEQEFDSKLSRATELSLQQAKWETSKVEVDEDGWPRYDPAMFEEEPASRKRKDPIATTSSSPPPAASSSSASIRPLPRPNLMRPSNSTGPPTRLDIAPLNITKKSESKVHHVQPLAGSSSKPLPFTSPSQPIPDREDSDQDKGTVASLSNVAQEEPEIPSYSQRATEEMTRVYPVPASNVVQQEPEIPSYSQRAAEEMTRVYPVPGSNVVQQEPEIPSYSQRETEEVPRAYAVPGSQFTPPSDPLPQRDPEPEPSNPWTPTLEPLDLPMPAEYPKNFPLPEPQPGPIVHVSSHIPHHQSFPPQPSPRVVLPERPRIHSTISQPVYVPRVSFNPNVAYGGPTTTTPPSRITPQKPHMAYNPHMLYNSVVSSQLNSSRTADSSPPLSSFQSQLWYNQMPTNTRPWTRPTDRPTSTYSTVSNPYGGIAPEVDQYSHYSNSNFHSMPDDRYINR